MACLCNFLFILPCYLKAHTIVGWLLDLITIVYEPTIISYKFRRILFPSFVLRLLFKLDFGYYRQNFTTFCSISLHNYWTPLTTYFLLAFLSVLDPWDTCDNSGNALRSWYGTVLRCHWGWVREKIFECSLKNRANFYKYFCIKNQ